MMPPSPNETAKRDFVKDQSRQTRSYLMELFRLHGFNPRSDLGQNFLIDINLIEFAVRAAELSKDDLVLEVGPGTGGMTTFLSAQAGRVISVEVDRNTELGRARFALWLPLSENGAP